MVKFERNTLILAYLDSRGNRALGGKATVLVQNGAGAFDFLRRHSQRNLFDRTTDGHAITADRMAKFIAYANRCGFDVVVRTLHTREDVEAVYPANTPF